MADADYVAVAEAYSAERPAHVELAELLGAALRDRLDALGLETIVSWRAKQIDSFVKKALRNGYENPGDQIGDKAGVRIIVHYLADIPTSKRLCTSCAFSNAASQSSTPSATPNSAISVCITTSPSSRTPSPKAAALYQLAAEIQIHTKAQSAWAVVSHELLYKSAIEPPGDLRRSITRLVALVELFDAEVARFREALEAHPDFGEMTVLPPLDDAIVRFSGRRPDPALSVLSVPAVVRLYDEAPEDVFERHIRPFLEAEDVRLSAIFAHYRHDDRANPLLFQPEALLIFERLEHDPDRLKAAWPVDRLPMDLLESLAAIWGVDV